jgi:recombinational DNA repair protein RecT
MAVEEPKKVENPIKALERQIQGAKTVKDVLKMEFAKDRYVKNFQAMSGRTDGLQQFESEAFNFMELANNKPEIMGADKFSIIAGFMRAGVWNLSFQGSDLSVYVRGGKLVVEPQAHGKRKLIEKMPGVKEVHEGILIFTKDEFEYDVATEKVIKHKQTWPRPEAKPENVLGAYVTIEYKNGDKIQVVVDQSEIAKARKASKMQDGGALWTQYYGEACKKTAYNRAFKVKWRKPEASVLYEQWEAPEGGSDDFTADAQVVEHTEPIMPDDTFQTTPSGDTVDTSSGEVIMPTIEVKKEEPTKEREKGPRRTRPSDGNLDL